MATFVLVHGGWHGGWCWRDVRATLQNNGHDVLTPTLTGLGERSHLLSPDIDLNTHILDARNPDITAAEIQAELVRRRSTANTSAASEATEPCTSTTSDLPIGPTKWQDPYPARGQSGMLTRFRFVLSFDAIGWNHPGNVGLNAGAATHG